MQSIRIIVGIDWGSVEHYVCALDPGGHVLKEHRVPHSGEGLGALTDWLTEISGHCLEAVQVAIEVPHGPIVETLLDRGCQVFSINPKQLDRFRDRFSVAGAKDDRRDARVLADALRTDPHCFRHLKLEGPAMLQLREWSRIHDEITQERLQEANRLRAQLQRYYPQFLTLSNDLTCQWVLDLWRHFPSPSSSSSKASAATIAKILKKHRVRRMKTPEVLTILRNRPITVAPGAAEASIDHIRLIVDRLELLNRQMHHCDSQIDKLVADHAAEATDNEEHTCEQRDIAILQSLPGVGRVVLATLLAEAPQAVRSRDYQALRALSGSAPVTIQSGKLRRVIRRRACHTRIARACYHWARVAMQRDPKFRDIYRRSRLSGASHGRALRAIADRLLAVACSMLRHGTFYDPAYIRKKA